MKVNLDKKIQKYLLITILFSATSSFCFSQEENLVVKGTTQAQSITIPGNISFPTSPVKGALFYRSDQKKFYIFNGAEWKEVGRSAFDKKVATKIVAASHSIDKSRADYVCDGVDDQVEIQQAIDDLPGYGGMVYLLEGTYNLTAPININKSNVTLMGTGAGTVLSVTSDKAISASDVSNIILSQFKINGGGDNSWFRFTNVKSSVIEKIWATGGDAIIEGSSYYNIFTKNFFYETDALSSWEGCLRFAYLSTEDAAPNHNIISNNIFKETATKLGAIQLTGDASAAAGPSFNIIMGNIINTHSLNDSEGVGVTIYDYTSGNIVWGNTISSMGEAGIRLFAQSTHNIVSGNLISQTQGGGAIINLTANADFTVISSNIASLYNGGGIYLSGDNNLLFGNIFYNCGDDTDDDGIEVLSGRNLISSNYIYHTNTNIGYGIYITSNDNYLVGNFIGGTGYSARLINDQGVNTKYTDKLKLSLEKTQIDISTSPYNLDVAGSPRSYVQLNPGVDVDLTLSNGKSAGDLLILENVSSSNTVTINDSGNVNLEGDRVLGQYDTLKLIWNGSKWLELRYVDN